MGGHPASDKKRGADRGFDGYINFFDDETGKSKKIVIQVKGGHVTVSQIRDLSHVVDREKAVIGVFITLNKPTQPMIQEAAGLGFYEAPNGEQFPKLQILTIEDLFDGKKINCPPYRHEITFKKARRRKQKTGEQLNLNV